MSTMVKGSGAVERETVLWENPSPTASFGEQTITLSESVANFKRLRIYYYSNINATDYLLFVDFDVTVPSKYYQLNNSNNAFFVLAGKNATSNYARIGYFATSGNYTKITWDNARLVPDKGTNNNPGHPIRICGIK